MIRTISLRVALLVVALLTMFVPSAAQPVTRGDPLSKHLGSPESPADAAYLRGIAEQHGAVRLIVSLQTEQAGRMAFDTMNEQSQQAVIAQTQDALLAELGMTRTALGVKRYTAFPALALEVNSDQLEIVQASSLVTHIREDRWREPSLIDGTTNIGMRNIGSTSGAWASGAEGEGQVVVVIDSGVSNTHPYLTGKVVDEVCFSSTTTGNGFTVSSFCPGGAAFSDAPGSGAPCTLSDPNANAAGQCHHGTHVANTIAGRDTINAGSPYDGVARKAKIISVQVFSRITDDSNPATAPVCNRSGYSFNECILASDSDILAGLDYVWLNFLDDYEVAAVNMSFGNESWESQAACNAAYPDYKARIDLFRAADVAVVSSSGNQGGLNFMNAPACISGVISVGANCDGSAGCLVNTIAQFTNAAPFLTFLAPGVSIDAAIPGVDAFGVPNKATKTGTSQSAAFVSGAYAALRSYRPGATIDQITTVLRDSATPIDDYATSAVESYKKIQVNGALPLLLFPDQPTLLSPAPNAAFAEAPITFVWTAGEETNNYRLQIYNNAKSSVLTAVTVKHVDCAEDPVNYPDDGEICAASINYNFKDDKFYQWRVVARNNSNGSSSRSEWRAFQFDTPGASTLLSPEHKITINQPEELDQLQWTEVALATQYRVTLFDTKNGAVKFNSPLLDESAVCVASVCTYTTTPQDRAGLRDDRKYKWYVTSISDDGTSQSAKRVIKAKFPAAPLLTGPADKHVFRSLNDIELTWTEVAAADEYQIQIVDTGNGKKTVTETLVVSARNVTCLSGTCTFVPSLDQRNKFRNKRVYSWTVTASNELGDNTSAPLTFKTKFPAPPVLIAPVSPITLDNPAITFTFTQIADADSYELMISLKSNGNVLVKRGLTPGGNLTCNGAECFYTLNANDQSKLKNGKLHVWFVRSVSPAGKSASPKREFTLQSPPRAALIAPAAGAKLHSRADAVFSWGDLGGGVSYQLRIKDTKSGKLTVKANASSAVCSSGTCTYMLNANQQAALKDGRDYKWWIVATNSFGKSASPKNKLKTQFPRTALPLLPADKHVLTSASDLTHMEWRSGGTTAPVTYKLRVRRTDTGKIVFQKNFPNGAGLGCDAELCQYAVDTDLQSKLQDGRNYKWWIVASSADGTKNGPKFTLKVRFP